jgi:hypothetical protein
MSAVRRLTPAEAALSPMQRLLLSGDDAQFREVLGVDTAVFGRLCDALTAHDAAEAVEEATEAVEGAGGEVTTARASDDDAGDAPSDPPCVRLRVAAVLSFLRSRCRLSRLDAAFRLGHAEMQRLVLGSMRRLHDALRRMPEAQAAWPTEAEQEAYGRQFDAVGGPCPVPGVRTFGVLEGIRLGLDSPTGGRLNTHYYEGMQGCRNILCVVLVSPAGKLLWASLNHPSHKTPYQAAEPLFEKLEGRLKLFGLDKDDLPVRDHMVLGSHSFFARRTQGLVGTLKGFRRMDGMLVPAPQGLPAWQEWAKKIRDHVEKTVFLPFRKTWARLQLSLPPDIPTRQIMLRTAFFLHNFSVHHCGLTDDSKGLPFSIGDEDFSHSIALEPELKGLRHHY